ncbi:transcriptional regulator with XRE-family HTH domain [Haloferula luteola]|uniref:Transcriptional regulator with XRE-family HTH domain n=1 Tax=Haloferula luteola TaxID=595692 RepID=A0A840VKK0_9BACT|nr:helix-turn-helix domain-containing protein [Haloferula luteola]MBB5353191.1 transcriptional regulator with XRE-family HTH domain [Haloferula luteola]
MARPKGALIDGRQLRSRREQRGMTQDQLAMEAGLTRSVVQKAERGGPLSPTTIQALARAVGSVGSSLALSEDWGRHAEEEVVSPFKPESLPKIGTVWRQTRELLYQMPPPILQSLALRNLARVVPVFSPKSAEATGHFRELMAAVSCARDALAVAWGSTGRSPTSEEMAQHADACFCAAGYTRSCRYEEDTHGADAAFAVAISAARVLESIITHRRDEGRQGADYWRAMEFGTSASHAAGHASVYLTIEDAFIRAATLDTHDLRNAADPGAILRAPLWEGGEAPAALRLFMNRFLRDSCFPHEARRTWNQWVRRGFQAPDGH